MSVNLPNLEANVLEFWKKNNIEAQHLALHKPNEEKKSGDHGNLHGSWTHLSGPPFATGLPHFGHSLVGMIKDTITRYKVAQGAYVERRKGWDTHGLPIEVLAEEKLGIKSGEELKNFPIKEYNDTCRSMVMQCAKDWKVTLNRMSRWIDLENDYKTMTPQYMESVWWAFKELYKLGLVYQGLKVMPYSTKLATVLSNSEADQDAKPARVKTIYFKVPLSALYHPPSDEKTSPPVSLVIWTTTPWSIATNCCVAINPKIKYVVAVKKSSPERLIVAKSKIECLGKDYTIEAEIDGQNLVGLSYTPPFPLPIEERKKLKEDEKGKKLLYTIFPGSFVSDKAGTGLVHISPAFGQDDYNLCVENGLIGRKSTDLPCLFDEYGVFKNIDFLSSEENDISSSLFPVPVLVTTIPHLVATDEKNEESKMENKKKKNGKKKSFVDPSSNPPPPISGADDETAHVENDIKKLNVFTINTIIIDNLKKRKILLRIEDVEKEQRFCPRTGTVLIDKASVEWFIDVPALKEEMLANNAKVNWIPEHFGKNAFNEWLKAAQPWCISRNRNFGNPIPIWVSDINGTSDGGEQEVLVIGSVQELTDLANVENGSVAPVEVKDLHRESIDHLTITSKKTGKLLRRISPVFDCWFESGCAPYAMYHYPFDLEQKASVDARITAPGTPGASEALVDFISEGTDQKRGFFYCLMVISTALFKKSPFKNVIVAGIVQAEDGQKMSKSKKNYSPPIDVMNTHGADALRLYLIGSPAARADDLKFSDKGVYDVVKQTLLQLFNALVFYQTWGHAAPRPPCRTESSSSSSDAIGRGLPINRWILAKLNNFAVDVHAAMAEFKVYLVPPLINKFVNHITTDYIQLNRNVLKGKETKEARRESLDVLYAVLLKTCKLVAPFMPFLSEHIYQELRKINSQSYMLDMQDMPLSVHLCPAVVPIDPSTKENKETKGEEKYVESAMVVLDLCRKIRAEEKMSVKKAFKFLTICSEDKTFLRNVEQVNVMVLKEANVLGVRYESDTKSMVKKRVVPNMKSLGQKFKKTAPLLNTALRALTKSEIGFLEEQGKIVLSISGSSTSTEEKFVVELSDVKIEHELERKDGMLIANEGEVTIMIDNSADPEIDKIYQSRILSTSIQKMRKTAKLVPQDLIEVGYTALEHNTSDFEKKFAPVLKNVEKLIGARLVPLFSGTVSDKSLVKRKEIFMQEILFETYKLKIQLFLL